MIKTCLICGKDFEYSAKNHKYCSDNCRAQASLRHSREWKERTNYVEKLKKEKNARRQKEAEEHREYMRQLHEERLAQIEADKKREQMELEERAKGGDYKALMQLAPDRLTYFKYFALNEIEESEKYGRKSTREINGISVYDPDFAELVLKSIEETGRYISKSNGLGEKIAR